MNTKTNKENGVNDLISRYLDAHNIYYVDYRKNNGYIFIAGEKTLSDELKQLKKAAIHIRFARNSSVFQGQSAWITSLRLYDCPTGVLDVGETVSSIPQGDDKMIALSELTSEQLQYICEHIPPKVVIDYFNSTPKEYNKIWKGRAQRLKKDRIVQILVANINNHFISSFVEKCIGLWFSEIRDFRQKLEDAGATTDESLIRALPGSVFSDDIDLYFQLCDEDYSNDYISLIKNVLPLIPSANEAEDIPSEEDRTEEIQKWQAEVETLNTRLEKVLAQIVDLEAQLSLEQALRKQSEDALATAISTRDELQTALNATKAHLSETTHINAHLQSLSRYADADNPKVIETEYEYASICRVVHSYSDQPWLIRLADISNGKISVFEQNEDAPRYFGNRDRLYWKNGPDEDGYVGIWEWNAQPNKNDSATDYVTTMYNDRMRFIEVVDIPTCRSISELIKYVASTRIPVFSSRKILFALPVENGAITGILCDESNFTKTGNGFALNSTVYILPQFTIKPSDIITISGMRFYRYTSLGLPQALAQVNDPMYAAKEIVLSRATSAVLRESGLSKKEAQHCRTFLGELPINTVAQELAELYACSEDEAQAYIAAFIEHADSYLCSADLDVSILSSALERNTELVEMCKNMLLSEWRKENDSLLTQAEQRLEDIETQIASGKAEKAELEGHRELLQKQLIAIAEDIQAKEQLALNVETKVADRIAAAKANIADFICEMAFAAGYSANSAPTKSAPVPNTTKVTHRICNYVQGDPFDDRDTFEEELAENLEKSGYTEKYAYEMSQVISFCISNRLPIVINENAGIISDCIAAMFGDNGAMEISLPLASSDCSALCEAIKTNTVSNYSVFVINGIFDGFSLNAYNELLQHYTEIQSKALLILSARGLSMNMIPVSVWNQAFFIDGDLNLTSVRSEAIKCFKADVDFTPSFDQSVIKTKKKDLKPFREFVGNTAQLNYAMYMAIYDEQIKSSVLLQLQLILASQNSIDLDELGSLFDAAGVNEEIHKLISKYQ